MSKVGVRTQRSWLLTKHPLILVLGSSLSREETQAWLEVRTQLETTGYEFQIFELGDGAQAEGQLLEGLTRFSQRHWILPSSIYDSHQAVLQAQTPLTLISPPSSFQIKGQTEKLTALLLDVIHRRAEVDWSPPLSP